MILKCPFCNKDTEDPAVSEAMKAIIRSIGLKSEHVGPGGRILEFESLGHLVLNDMCVVCNFQKFMEFLKSHLFGRGKLESIASDMNWMITDMIWRFNQSGVEGNYSTELTAAIKHYRELCGYLGKEPGI